MDKILEEALKDIQKHEKLSRRDALKIFGASPLVAALLAEASMPTDAEAASDATGKIVIVGAGLAGLSTAARLTKKLKNPNITIIEPNQKSVSYQAGTSLIVAGVMNKEDVDYYTADFLPDGVKWIQKAAANFDPKANKVILDDGSEISYDYLVIATGIMLDYGAVDGLTGMTTTSSTDNAEVKQTIGKNGIYSLYFIDGAVDAKAGIDELIAKAKALPQGQKLEAVFSDSPTAIKCGGAPKKIAYITNDLLERAGVKDRVNITFYTNSGALFNVPEYAKAIEEQFIKRDFKFFYKTKLVAVDPQTQTATFEKSWEEKGEWDEDLQEFEMVKKTEQFQKKFDFLHVVPHQKVNKAVADSPVGSANGWVPVDKETLQHVVYKNVFSLGDCAAIPLGKTGGSARKQYKVVVSNLIAQMEGKELTAKYDGYTVCPLITKIGRVMFAEFDWKGVAPTFPLDPTQERWTMWLLKAYLMKPMVMYGMLPGRI